MSKTYTPELSPDVLRRPEDYAAGFRAAFGLDRPARWSPNYLAGLIREGERKGIEPLSRRVELPPNSGSRTPSRRCSSSSTRAPGTSGAS